MNDNNKSCFIPSNAKNEYSNVSENVSDMMTNYSDKIRSSSSKSSDGSSDDMIKIMKMIRSLNKMVCSLREDLIKQDKKIRHICEQLECITESETTTSNSCSCRCTDSSYEHSHECKYNCDHEYENSTEYRLCKIEEMIDALNYVVYK